MSEPIDLNAPLEDTGDFSTYTLLPKGTFPFTVVGKAAKKHNGTAKLSAGVLVDVECEVNAGHHGKSVVKRALWLDKSTMGFLVGFFRCIGMLKAGGRMDRMDWDGAIGKDGWCKISHRQGKDGRWYNELEQFIVPENAPAEPVVTGPAPTEEPAPASKPAAPTNLEF